MYEYYDKRVYEIKDHNPEGYNQALNKIREWDYNMDTKIALGVFYKKTMPTFEEKFLKEGAKEIDRDLKIKEFLKNAV